MLGLTFALRHRTVDVVLADVRALGAIAGSIRREAAFMVVSPPDGDLLALGISQRVELEELLVTVKPLAALGVGNRALGSGLVSMRFFQEEMGCALRSVNGRLGAGPGELRQVLADGFRLWASTGARLTMRPPMRIQLGGS
jgi:hypothetical protein